MAIVEFTHDDLVAFARTMTRLDWWYADEPTEVILDFFEKPHKWDREMQKWRSLNCDEIKFGEWLDKRCSKCGRTPDEGTCMYCEPEEDEELERDAIYRAQTRVTG